ncbi:Protein of uncharacterised function (DUF2637) [Mycobacteroides abscessus subsp. massiliense]|uniref:hypothetical protein n=1 Tax=Mycobacteroides abscessus TaxID=36809 RepID=UPI0009A616E2|nr:hypothetical protein [Mycobacteroides abscessus]SKE70724.1 Protein of uncharacterised function (DUF2637) [Mycobacteroides abscessus subsp. massiliense]SKH80546.1 Protein of uncharacterised function (DUF2637) [Mycobacteroides abscessus subsp. massiliense]SKI34237.1 Protein of uncharacterised function (DUF2637) [Mycobacteroides abscessus subsp. massiliense]SKJ36914.1 Protein of uncharacterised function (DUF2637) [Mycobacteroides abscessus subsp. massiliense]SKK23250.1 Protein of uncharacteris
MITPALQAPPAVTGPADPATGGGMCFQTRDLHVYPGFEGVDESKPNQGSATTRATNTATEPATSAVAADQPDRSAGTATVAVDQPNRSVPPFPQVTAYEEKNSMENDRKAFTRLLLGCTTVSLAGNVAYAVERGAVAPVSIALAAVAPILLPVGVHYIPKAARVRRGARFVVTVAVIVAATAAFVLSFEALSGLMRMRGHDGWTAYLLPVAVDVLAAAAAYALVVEPDAVREESASVTIRQRVRRAIARVLRRDAPLLRDEAPVTRPVEAPAMRDAAPAPTATQTASVRDAALDEPATHAATQRDALRDADTEELPVTSGDSRDAAAKQGTEPSTTQRLTAVPTTRTAATHAPASPATQTAPDRDADDAEYLLRAQQLVDAGRTKAPVEVVVRVLRGKANGMSNRDLADETGLSESAVQRIVTAARELDAAEPAFA